MTKEVFTKYVQELILPLFTGSHIAGEDVSTNRDSEVAQGNGGTMLVKPHKEDEYRLIIKRSQPFKNADIELMHAIIEELDKSTGSLDDFGGEYTNSILENLANNLEENNITEKAICFIKRVRDLKTVGRVTGSDYVQIIKWILSKCQDKDFSDKIDVTSFVCEDTIELPRKILLKISGEKFIQFDYKTKEYEELREAPTSISMNRERSV